MKILHLADMHIYLSGPRAEECRRIIDWIAANAKETKPDAIVIAGDVFERRSTPQERIYFAEFLRALSSVARVFIINGNHDDADDLRLFRKEYGWTMPIEIHLEPGVVAGGGAALAFLPWPSLGEFAAKAAAGESIVSRRELARAALVDVLRGFSTHAAIAAGKPSLLVAHISVTGASMDSGQPVSGSEELALAADELLLSGAAGVALGHIHLRQEMKGLDARPVWYAGAPFRGSFGEAKGTKGGLLWDWDGKAWKVTPWEIPARSMVLIERTYISPAERDLDSSCEMPEEEPLAADDIVKDADVRVRITFSAEFREGMRAAMAGPLEQLRAVAHSVVVEERASLVSRTRCSEISEARTTLDKLSAWAQAVGAELPAGAAVKVAALEAEVVS